jgi:hypothetical protein
MKHLPLLIRAIREIRGCISLVAAGRVASIGVRTRLGCAVATGQVPKKDGKKAGGTGFHRRQGFGGQAGGQVNADFERRDLQVADFQMRPYGNEAWEIGQSKALRTKAKKMLKCQVACLDAV